MRAIFCGSFDPVTEGHLDIIKRAARVYETLIVNVGNNSDKKALFPVEERVNLIKEAIKDLPERERILVISDGGMTVDIAMAYNANVLIRGIRPGTDDMAKEKNLLVMNQYLAKIRGFKLETKFYHSDDVFMASVSSTAVKKLFELHQYIAAARCVPANVHEAMCEIYLRKLWLTLFKNESEANCHWKDLAKAYRGRPYHNLSHIAYMLNMLQIYLSQNSKYTDFSNHKELVLAIFMHDYVYNTNHGDNSSIAKTEVNDNGRMPLPYSNERASAGIIFDMRNDLDDSISVELARGLVMATTHSGDRLNNDYALIADLDLSILGAFEKRVWKNYNAAIRKEYAAYPDEIFNQERKKVLEKFADSKQIFHTQFFYNQFEEQAHRNLNFELSNL
ncbi:MAG: pantetheine-phosphate adenylyltransferase [Alphaproteobacteria bacterium]|nr:pantetheine-phosphate adenylyltransferase [Alphaproteobacteria bacterium]